MLNPHDIIKATEDYYHLPNGKVLQHCRTSTVSEARAVSQYLIRKLTRRTWYEIAAIWKHHHTSIIYNVRRIKRSSDSWVLEAVSELEEHFKGV